MQFMNEEAPIAALYINVTLWPYKGLHPQPKLVLLYQILKDGRLGEPSVLGSEPLSSWTVTHV